MINQLSQNQAQAPKGPQSNLMVMLNDQTKYDSYKVQPNKSTSKLLNEHIDGEGSDNSLNTFKILNQ